MKVLKCNSCGARVIVDKDCNCPCGFVCCDEKMVEVVPNSVDAAFEKHVPVYEVSDDKLIVSVNHVMEEEHYIEWIAFESEEGLDIRYLSPGDTPKVVFEIGKGTLYAFCNKHGLWEKEID